MPILPTRRPPHGPTGSARKDAQDAAETTTRGGGPDRRPPEHRVSVPQPVRQRPERPDQPAPERVRGPAPGPRGVPPVLDEQPAERPHLRAPERGHRPVS